MFRHKQPRKPRWSTGERIRVRSRDEIRAGLDSVNKRDQCLMTEQMWDYCGRHFGVAKVVSHLFDERKNRLYRSHAPLYVLEHLICHGRTDDFPHRCDRSCYLIWHEDWLDAVQGERGVDMTAVTESPGSSLCQLRDLVNMGTLSRADTSLGGVREGLKKVRGAAITFRKRLLSGGARRPIPVHPVNHDIGPGDVVRVRSRQEVLSGLDDEGKYGGCKFMRGMYDHCGNTYRVLKNVEYFFDEARQKMVKTKDLVILDGALCGGQQRLFVNRCDRNCFFFWHKAWLEKIL